MPLYSLKLSIYDPEIIDSFERLRKSRKQAAFTHEAVKHFLLTDKGKQVLMFMEGKASETSPSVMIYMAPNTMSSELPAEQTIAKSHQVFAEQRDGSSVLDSILE